MNLENQLILSLIRKEKKLNIENINWKELLRIINKHKLLPVIYKELSRIIPQNYSVLYKDALEKSITKQRKLWELYKVIALEAEKEGIKIVLPKGFPIAHELYGSINLRPSADIDLLVREDDIERLCNIVTKLGCFHRHNSEIKNVVDKFTSKKFDNFYELKFIKFDAGDFLWVEVKKATDAIPESYIANFIDSAKQINIEGEKVWSLDDIHMFIHLCANTHKDTEGHEGICTNTFRLRNFVDLYLFITKKGNKIDWNKVGEFSKQYDVILKVQWALLCLKEIFPCIKENVSYISALNYLNKGGDHNILQEPNTGKIFNETEHFTEWFFDNQLAKINYNKSILKRRWSSENHNFSSPNHIGSNITSETIGTGFEYSLFYKNGRIQICLKNGHEIKDILKEDRLYFSFIGRENSELIDIDSIGNPSIGVMFFLLNDVLMAKISNMKMWTVNYGSYKNEQLKGGFEVLYDKEKDMYSVEIDIEKLIVDKLMIAYNIWLDGAVLDDYYRHKWYKYDVNKDIGILKIV